MEAKATSQLESQLDKQQYDESDLISIKIPVSLLSYYTNSKTYERVDGEIELGGIRYSFVKRRWYRDSLEMLCVEDFFENRIRAAGIEIFQTVNDLSHNCLGRKPGSHTHSSKSFSMDIYTISEQFKLSELYYLKMRKSIHFSAPEAYYFPPTIENPPEFI